MAEARQSKTRAETSDDPKPLSLAPRAIAGGTLMGLANLVPGISGGTMLLAVGIYPRFVQSVAEVTRLRFRVLSIAVLAMIATSAALAIGLLAGTLRDLVVDHRWVMYSLFIGLTFGGLPLLIGMIRPPTLGAWIGAGIGAIGMAALGLAQASSPEAVADGGGFLGLTLAGIAGASAMVLPGVSGGYLLLLLGQYLPILGAIDDLKTAVTARDLGAAMDPALSVLLPVGIGVAIGIAGVSNLLAVLLKRYEKATLGVLAGLLIGAVFGLWPFQETATADGAPGRPIAVAETDLAELPLRYFRPGLGQVAASLGLIAAGFLTTTAISRYGRPAEDPGEEARNEPPLSTR
jgi:putative membrane protein